MAVLSNVRKEYALPGHFIPYMFARGVNCKIIILKNILTGAIFFNKFFILEQF